METDSPLKLPFSRYPEDLLALTGDAGATVHRAGPVEIQALKRRVDCVLKLERVGEPYYRPPHDYASIALPNGFTKQVGIGSYSS